MADLELTEEDSFARNIKSIVDFMDILEGLNVDFENGVEINQPFEMTLVDDDGNEFIFVIQITTETFIPLNILALQLSFGLRLHRILMAKLAIRARLASLIGFVFKSSTGGLINTASFTTRVATLSTRVTTFATTQVGARVANTALGRLLSRFASVGGGIGGFLARFILAPIAFVDLFILTATAIIRALDEIALATDDPSAGGKADRQAAISELIMEYDFLWSLYNYDPTPAETYGLDYPFGAVDLLIRPFIVEQATEYGLELLSEGFSENMILALIQGSIFTMVAEWLGLGVEFISVTVNLIESDVIYSPDSDVSQFISEYWADQQQKIYQDVINTFLADPYYLLELFIAAIAAKTFYNTYLPHFASVFQTQNA